MRLYEIGDYTPEVTTKFSPETPGSDLGFYHFMFKIGKVKYGVIIQYLEDYPYTISPKLSTIYKNKAKRCVYTEFGVIEKGRDINMMNMNLTNNFDAFKVLGAVFNLLIKFIDEHKPEIIHFSVVDEGDENSGRSRVYDHLTRVLKEKGYTLLKDKRRFYGLNYVYYQDINQTSIAQHHLNMHGENKNITSSRI